jgi:hypothetical protein
MTDTSDESTRETRERLEDQADTTRARLLDHLDTLDDRRERAKRFLEHAGGNVKRHKTLLLGMGVGVLVAVALVAFVRRRNAKRKPNDVLLQALKNLLGPGFVIESVERRDRRFNGPITKAAIGVGLRVANEMGKRHVSKWLDAEGTARGQS